MYKVYGPYNRRDGRMHVIVKYDDGTRRTVSYPRWIMERHLGRRLEDNEEVDHIDQNRFNNSIDNLEIVTREENGRRYMAQFPKEIGEYVCPQCGEKFKKDAAEVRHNKKQGKAGPFCGKPCAAKYTYSKGVNRGRKLKLNINYKPNGQD